MATTEEKVKALDRANKWAPAGKEAHDLALAVEKAALEGEIVPITKENLETTIRGAMKLFLDGNISSRDVANKLKSRGLDMKNIRKSIVEQTMANAIPQMIDEGDIERVAAVAEMAGEAPKQEIPDNAKRIVRERVEIIIDD